MRWEPVHKTTFGGTPPTLADYDTVRARFTWDDAARALDGLPGGRGLNIAHEAVDRHGAGAYRDTVALRCLSRSGEASELTYAQLAAETGRFANALRALGVGRGDRVFSLLGRVPELYVSALGTLKNTSVLSPLFPAFGPGPIAERIGLGDGKVLVTSSDLYARKVAPIRDRLPGLEHVILVGEEPDVPAHDGIVSYRALMEAVGPPFEIPPTDPEDMALLHFTSGTTGRPKGALHVHGAVVAHHATAAFALDLRAGDVFWCTADPGRATGTSYGIIAPLTHGATLLVDTAEFDARRWYRILEEQRVTVWYTAPTALRMLMRHGAEPARGHDLSALRFIASVGEPLDPKVIVWAQETLGLPVHDTWWQTETGAIMIGSCASMDIRSGSMGRPLPGVEAALLERGPDGRAAVDADRNVQVIDKAGVDGELALRAGWPSMFRGYLHDEARYAAAFAEGWYLTGDIARRDDDGYLWFVARADRVVPERSTP